MTKYMDKSFTVGMPGNNAKQWPKCGKPVDISEMTSSNFATEAPCSLEMGHKGDCSPDFLDVARKSEGA